MFKNGRSALCAAGMVLAACASAPRAEPAARPERFEYTLRLGSERLGGLVVLAPDTALIEPFGGTCWTDRDPTVIDTWSVRFRCESHLQVDNLMLTFDRRYPLRGGSWSGNVVRRVTRRVCAQEGRDAQGRTTCLRYETRAEEVRQPASGQLAMRPRTG